jgi:hypothetical protein
MTNIQSPLRTAPDLRKNVSMQYYSVATAMHTQSPRSQIGACVCFSQYREFGRAKEI